MAAKTITIYGQAFIVDNSLVQDQTLITDTTQSENTVILVPDIWEDLKSVSGKWKSGKNGFFYWEVEMTDMEDTERTVKVKIPCPKPEPSFFDFDFEETVSDSDWTKYWKSRMKAVEDSLYNSTNAIQPKEVIFRGSKHIDQNGNTVELKDTKVVRNDLGDIQNLLMNLY